MSLLPYFKAYDVRGTVPDQLNEESAYLIGRAYAAFLNPKTVVIGHDVRHSCAMLVEQLTRALTDAGVDVYHLGLCGTEEVYHATFSQGFDGGIMITASHNPPQYNGMKMVRELAKPISEDTGLQDMAAMVVANDFPPPVAEKGKVHALDLHQDYATYLERFVDIAQLKPLKIVTNAGNGGAGQVIDLLEKVLPFEFIKLQHEPDGDFPNGVPNPLLIENRAVTADAVRKHNADFGVAWDGDFDRCFLFDETGEFVESYYLVGFLARVMLQQDAGANIVLDPRLVWNTLDEVDEQGGKPVLSKSGHAFIKQTMRDVDAIYGGEMSAHHYFRDFSYCDNGNIPWLLVAQLISQTGQTLSQMIGERAVAYPISGEINLKVRDAKETLAAIDAEYEPQANAVERLDGLGFEFDQWRFNLRASNTEPVIRLNIEVRSDKALLQTKTGELLAFLSGFQQ